MSDGELIVDEEQRARLEASQLEQQGRFEKLLQERFQEIVTLMFLNAGFIDAHGNPTIPEAVDDPDNH